MSSEKATLPTYHPIPAADIPRGTTDFYYPTLSAPSSGAAVPEFKVKRDRKNRLLVVVLASFALFMLLSAVRSGARSGSFMRGCHGRLFGSSSTMRNATGFASLPSHYTLPSGDKIPSVALGVWQAPPDEVIPAVEAALKAGYRHIDGAWIYGNEKEVGEALSKSGVKRDDVWLTSKLWNLFHAPEDVEKALDESLTKLGVDYLDLYLIHWPVAFKGNEKKDGKPVIDEELTADPYPTWQKLEELVEKGKIRNIGVSNFNVPRLKNLTANPLKIQPAVNQVELNFFNPQPELLAFAKTQGLLLEAYSPLGSSKQVKEALQVPEVREIAKVLGITPAQVLISWHVQRGTIVLPKSVTPSRVVENLQVRALPPLLFAKLEKAATTHKPQRVVNPSRGWGLKYDIFDDYPYDQ